MVWDQCQKQVKKLSPGIAVCKIRSPLLSAFVFWEELDVANVKLPEHELLYRGPAANAPCCLVILQNTLPQNSLRVIICKYSGFGLGMDLTAPARRRINAMHLTPDLSCGCSEAEARQTADTAEAQARKEADSTEAQVRQAADAAEAQARDAADASEAKARHAGDAATYQAANNYTDAAVAR